MSPEDSWCSFSVRFMIALSIFAHVLLLLCACAKVGNMLYCSTRSMVPVLRNCYVYFEISVLPRLIGKQPSLTTLSIGLSTEEMPPNTLVGAWQGSCGLCTTGQILTAGQVRGKFSFAESFVVHGISFYVSHLFKLT